MFSHFFIDRPIFASVLSIVITLAGARGRRSTCRVAQYPQITPPSIMVQCTYPGANAQVVAESVAAPIEQQVNGVEDMMYMVVAVEQRRLLHADRHLQARRQPELRPGAGAEPHQPGPAAACPTWSSRPASPPASATPTSCWSSAVYSPERPLRPALPQQLRHHPGQGRARPRGRRRRRATSSASRTTACASGSTPSGWRR